MGRGLSRLSGNFMFLSSANGIMRAPASVNEYCSFGWEGKVGDRYPVDVFDVSPPMLLTPRLARCPVPPFTKS